MHMSISPLTYYLNDYITFGIVILKYFYNLVYFQNIFSNVKGLIFWGHDLVILHPIEEMLSWVRTLENI